MKYEECWTLLQIDLVLDSPGNCDASNLMLQDVAWIIIDCHRLMIGYPQMIRYHCRNILEFTAFTSLGSSQISWVLLQVPLGVAASCHRQVLERA